MIQTAIAFSSSPAGLTLAGALAAVVVIWWDWRVALAALFGVQGAISTATVYLSQVPQEWALIQMAIMGLSCLILGMSAAQVMGTSPSARQAGSLWLRVMAVLALYGGWRLLDVQVTLPETDPGIAQLYGWLALCAFLILGLGASPLFSGVAVLLWIAIVQAFVASVLQVPSLVALIGILELMVALACSYLLIAEWRPVTRERPILTDVAFPEQTPHVDIGFDIGTVTGTLTDAVGRQWARHRRQLLAGTVKEYDDVESDDALPEGRETGAEWSGDVEQTRQAERDGVP